MWSSMRVKAKMAIVDTTINVSNIGQSRFQVTFPNDIASHSPHDDSRGGNGQKSRESCGFAVCRQEERQHRHNEDAKAEARGALHKTGPDAQQEYGYHNTTHRYSVKKKSISLPLLAAGLE